jgi:hypothetical protein
MFSRRRAEQKPKPISWKVVAACLAGFGHEADGTPCQDAYYVSRDVPGWLIAVVSDGAGSATCSKEGSEVVSRMTVESIAHALKNNDWAVLSLRELVTAGVENARAELGRLAADSGRTLDDYHATLVGIAANASKVLFFHIGDGAAIATRLDDLSTAIVSRPENGEYANETYFVTQEEWREHLRFIDVDGTWNLFALMSDGVTPLALASDGSGPFVPFFQPISNYLQGHSEDEGGQSLSATLRREQIRRITGDDKTLVWAARLD